MKGYSSDYSAWVEAKEGKLRIKKVEYINKTFRLPVPLVEEMATIAQRKNISVTQLVILLCEYGIANLDEDT